MRSCSFTKYGIVFFNLFLQTNQPFSMFTFIRLCWNWGEFSCTCLGIFPKWEVLAIVYRARGGVWMRGEGVTLSHSTTVLYLLEIKINEIGVLRKHNGISYTNIFVSLTNSLRKVTFCFSKLFYLNRMDGEWARVRRERKRDRFLWCT